METEYMIWINGTGFHEKPTSCGCCPFYHSASTYHCPSSDGVCMQFRENHKSYINPPKRCQKLFNKAFRMPEGSQLVIVIND